MFVDKGKDLPPGLPLDTCLGHIISISLLILQPVVDPSLPLTAFFGDKNIQISVK